MKACKKKELVPVTCDKCKKNFCFRHRWETDHDCQGPPAKGSFISNTAAAAISRFSQQSSSIGSRNHYSLPPVNSRNKQPTTSAYQRPSSNHVKNIQGNMTEDEALARALQASIQPSVQHSDTRPMNDQEKEDRELSLALQMSEQQQNRQANPEQKEKSCSTM